MSGRFIHDHRWSSNDAIDELQIIFEGSTYVEEKALDTAIVFHSSFECFELILFEPPTTNVWTRFYFPKDHLRARLSAEEYDRIVEEKKDFFRKRHRHFDLDTLKSGAKHELLKRVILSLVPDLLSYDLSHRLQDEKTPYVKDVFHRPAVFNGYDLQSITYIAAKPDFLVPANVLPHETEASYTMFLLAQRQHQHCRRVVRAFQATLSRKYTVNNFHNHHTKHPSSPTRRNNTTNTSTNAFASTALTMSGKMRAGLKLSSLRASFASSLSGKHRNILAIYGTSTKNNNQNNNNEEDEENDRTNYMMSGKSGKSFPSFTTAATTKNTTNASANSQNSAHHHHQEKGDYSVGPSMAKRLGSFFGRRISIIATGLGTSFTFPSSSASLQMNTSINTGDNDNGNSNTVLKKIAISHLRYKWIKAIDRVITRNWLVRFKTLLQRHVMMHQLKRAILRQRSDYALLMQQSLQGNHHHDANDEDDPSHHHHHHHLQPTKTTSKTTPTSAHAHPAHHHPTNSQSTSYHKHASPTTHSHHYTPRHSYHSAHLNSSNNNNATTTAVKGSANSGTTPPSPINTHRTSHVSVNNNSNNAATNSHNSHGHGMEHAVKLKPVPTNATTTPSTHPSFKSTLSQVRNRIAAATAFARFEHLRINTHVGAEPAVNSAAHTASHTASHNATTHNTTTHNGEDYLHNNNNYNNNHSHHHHEYSKLVSASSATSMTTQLTINTATTANTAQTAHTTNNNNTSSSSQDSEHSTRMHPSVTPTSSSSHNSDHHQSYANHSSHYHQSYHNTNGNTNTTNKLSLDSPLMRHASRRVAAAN